MFCFTLRYFESFYSESDSDCSSIWAPVKTSDILEQLHQDIDTWYYPKTLRNDRGDTKNDGLWYTCLPDFITNIESSGTMRDTQKTMTVSAMSFRGCDRFSPLLISSWIESFQSKLQPLRLRRVRFTFLKSCNRICVESERPFAYCFKANCGIRYINQVMIEGKGWEHNLLSVPGIASLPCYPGPDKMWPACSWQCYLTRLCRA